MSIEEEYTRVREQARLDSMPMLKDLQEAGVPVENVWDIEHPDHYPQCIPILIKYLGADFHPNVISGMAMKLTVPEVADFWDDLLVGYEAQGDDSNRGVIANPIVKTMNKDRAEDVRRILQNRANGRSRVVILHDVKKKIRGERGIEIIEELVDDPDIGWLAKEKLGETIITAFASVLTASSQDRAAAVERARPIGWGKVSNAIR